MNARLRDHAKLGLLSLAIGLATGPAHAASGLFEELEADYKLTLNYGIGIRTERPAPALIDGPIDPFELHLDQIDDGSAFTHTGLPTTINQDDGNRNFARWSLINNRVSALAEAHFSAGNYGLVVSGDGFYDFVYHRSNDNDSPDTINKTGPVDEFSDDARHYDGERLRLLDAYFYGNWAFGSDVLLDLRAGKQLIAWGESLFFPGVSSAQSTADATKAFTPGVEIKQILLPTLQASFNLAIGYRLSLAGYYKFEFRPNEIFPVGDYLSPTDSVGPGAEFSYGALNPLYLDGCPGLLGPLSDLCQLGGLGGTLLDAPPYILIPYEGERLPSRYGQYGLGVKFQATAATTLGLYALRYTDPNPTAVQTSGYPVIATFPVTLTTQIINEPTADAYHVEYFDGIRMLAASYSTVLGPFNVAGELSYRNGASIAVQAIELGTVNPVFSRGDTIQALSSLIYATNPHLWFDDLAFVAEAGYVHVIDVDAAQSQPGIVVRGDGKMLFYDRDAWGFQLLAMPTKRNLLSGWDLTLPTTFGWLVNGNPSMPGSFGALYGEGDMRASLGVSMQYLQNLQIGLNYNMFFGDADKNIGDSFLKQNPYVDRDNLAINFKYAF